MLISVKAFNLFMVGLSLVLTSLLTYNDSPTEPSYAVIMLSVLGVVFISLVHRGNVELCYKSNSVRHQLFIFLPIVMIFVWIYGFFMAVLNGNDLSAAIRNFAGMFFYLFLYVLLIVRPSKSQVLSIFFIAFFIQIIYAIYYSRPFFDGTLVFDSSISISENKAAYSVGFSIFLPFVSFLLFYFISTASIRSGLEFYKVGFFTMFVLLGSVVFSIIPNLSKGFFLALFIAVFIPFLYCSFLTFIRAKWSFSFFGSVILILMLCALSFTLFSFWEQIAFTFSNAEQSNAERSNQFALLVQDLSFFGKGLGALVEGYHRSHYGLELTYLSLIHKFGVFGFLIIFYFLLTFYFIFVDLTKRKKIFESFFCFGLMLYTIPAAGNPLLFSPLMILFHCFAIYFLLVDDRQPSFRLGHNARRFI